MFYCYKATRLSESQPGYLNQKGWDRQTIRLRRLGLVALMMLFAVGLFLSREIDARWLMAAGIDHHGHWKLLDVPISIR